MNYAFYRKEFNSHLFSLLSLLLLLKEQDMVRCIEAVLVTEKAISPAAAFAQQSTWSSSTFHLPHLLEQHPQRCQHLLEPQSVTASWQNLCWHQAAKINCMRKILSKAGNKLEPIINSNTPSVPQPGPWRRVMALAGWSQTHPPCSSGPWQTEILLHWECKFMKNQR